jgi:uncharacterized membrane protein SirB2
MIVPSMLDALFILDGLALLTLADAEWFQSRTREGME